MATYTCIEEIKGPLKKFDTVKFKLSGNRIVVYRVIDSYLQYDFYESTVGDYKSQRNDIIFELLGFTEDEKIDFLSKRYNYTPSSGEWPECEWQDYSALTRAIIGLYKYIKDLEYSNFIVVFPVCKDSEKIRNILNNLQRYGYLGEDPNILIPRVMAEEKLCYYVALNNKGCLEYKILGYIPEKSHFSYLETDFLTSAQALKYKSSLVREVIPFKPQHPNKPISFVNAYQECNLTLNKIKTTL